MTILPGFPEDKFSMSPENLAGETFQVTWQGGAIDDRVTLCEPETCAFLLRGLSGIYVVHLKADSASLEHIRALCRPATPDDVNWLSQIREHSVRVLP